MDNEKLKIKLTNSTTETAITVICNNCGMDLNNNKDFEELCSKCTSPINTNISFYCIEGNYNYGQGTEFKHYCKGCFKETIK